MTVYAFGDKKPIIDKNTYIDKTCVIIGEVTIGSGCFIGPYAVLRGDRGSIKIGNNTSIQDGCIIHADPEIGTVIGNNVTIGHNAVIHNAHIEDYAIVGMSAVVTDYAKVGKWSIVAEGCVVKKSQEIPSGKIVAGVPAKIIGDVNDEYKDKIRKNAEVYVSLAGLYRGGYLKEIV